MSRAREFADLAGAADAGGLTGRNLIINGAAVIDQRNGGSSVSATAGNTKFFADRWKADIAGGVNGVFSAQQQTSVVPTGFQYATKLTVTTAHTTAGTAHYYRYYYAGIEGYDTNQLELGTGNAKTVTISFYARSSITGTYCVGIQNATFNRAYAAEYSISSADTWERKEVTIALDQTGTWNSTNGIGIRLFWDLGSGSNWNMTADTWAATNTWKTSNQTAWIENASATFYITGVQLEVGEQATPFDHSESYGETLARCQRYFFQMREGSGEYTQFAHGRFYSTSAGNALVRFPAPMRANPTLTSLGSAGDYDFSPTNTPQSGQVTTAGNTAGGTSDAIAMAVGNNFSGVTSGAMYILGGNGGTGGPAGLQFDAEL